MGSGAGSGSLFGASGAGLNGLNGTGFSEIDLASFDSDWGGIAEAAAITGAVGAVTGSAGRGRVSALAGFDSGWGAVLNSGKESIFGFLKGILSNPLPTPTGGVPGLRPGSGVCFGCSAKGRIRGRLFGRRFSGFAARRVRDTPRDRGTGRRRRDGRTADSGRRDPGEKKDLFHRGGGRSRGSGRAR